MKTLRRLETILHLIGCYTSEMAVNLLRPDRLAVLWSEMQAEFDRLMRQYSDEDLAGLNALLGDDEGRGWMR
ncbi:MAG: hypothetical protein IT429_17060 [Gemmataceae bacterium]|nr:hypothetical protein [Gemmataceae bacterium]